jgi:coenzyme PQQ precursor peptide PqqA
VAEPIAGADRRPYDDIHAQEAEDTMAWTTPTLIEICVGLEINGYLPAEF